MDGVQPAVLVAEVTPPPAAVEAAADASVAIAQIDADRSVAVTQIDADRSVEIARIEAESEDEDIKWLRGELDGLRAQCETLREGLSAATLAQNATQEQVTSLTAMLAEHLNTLTPPAHSPPQTAEATRKPGADAGGGAVEPEVPAPRPTPRYRRL